MNKFTGLIRKAFSHPLARGSMTVFIGTTLANIGAYLYHLVVGRIMGPSGYGELAALLSVSYIFNVITVLLQTVTTRFVAEHNAKQQYGKIRSYLIKMTVYILGFGALCMFILLFAAPMIAGFLHIESRAVVYYLFAGITFSFLGMMYSSVLQGVQRFTEGMILMNVNSVLRLVSGVIAAPAGVPAAMGANTVAVAIAALVTLWPIRSILGRTHRAETVDMSPLFKTSAYTFLAILGISVLNSQDVILVKHFFPAAVAGWYGALSTMGKIVFFASSSVSYVLLPIVTQRTATGIRSTNLVYVSLLAVSVLSGGITLFFFLVPEFALGLLYGEAFVSVASLLGLFAVFSSLYALAYTVFMSILGLGKASVWFILVAAAVMQNVFIQLFHSSLSSVITVNILVAAALCISLLIYYRHAVKER